MNCLIMDYLVIEGFKEVVEKFKMELGIQFCVLLENLDERIKIRVVVQCGDIEEVIVFMNKLNLEIFDCKLYLYFYLQQ